MCLLTEQKFELIEKCIDKHDFSSVSIYNDILQIRVSSEQYASQMRCSWVSWMDFQSKKYCSHLHMNLAFIYFLILQSERVLQNILKFILLFFFFFFVKSSLISKSTSRTAMFPEAINMTFCSLCTSLLNIGSALTHTLPVHSTNCT